MSINSGDNVRLSTEYLDKLKRPSSAAELRGKVTFCTPWMVRVEWDGQYGGTETYAHEDIVLDESR